MMMRESDVVLCTDPRRSTFGSAVTGGSLSSQHQYQVTESNDVTLKEHDIVQPAIFRHPQDLDISRLYSIIINNPQPQSNELFANHPPAIRDHSDTSVTSSNIPVEFAQSNMPVQTNLHSSLHVGFPSTAIPQPSYTIAQQIPADLHVGHPAPAGPPLSASQLYDLLNNNFPHKLTERYTTGRVHLYGIHVHRYICIYTDRFRRLHKSHRVMRR